MPLATPNHQRREALRFFALRPYGEAARVIGQVSAAPPGRVTVKTVIGTTRLLDPPSGDLLPRIC